MLAPLHRRSLWALFLFAAIFHFSSSAHGYALEGVSWPAGKVVTMQMSLGYSPAALQDGNTSWNAAALPAIDEWNANIVRAQFTTVLNSSVPVKSNDGKNSVVFSSDVFGQSFGSGVLAITYYWSDGSNDITEADVLFNTAQPFDSYRGDLQFNSQGKAIADIRRVFLHELGHALGLNHPDQANQHVDAVMNSVISDTYALTADDLSGIHFLYGAPTGTPTPTPTPTPADT